MRLESKTGTIGNSDEKIFNFLSNFKNFEHLIPKDRVRNLEVDDDSFSFSVDLIGSMGVKIAEKEPYKLIKLSSKEDSRFDFSFWVQIKKAGDELSHIKLTLDAKINPMIQMMVKKPAQEFLDKLVDQMAELPY